MSSCPTYDAIKFTDKAGNEISKDDYKEIEILEQIIRSFGIFTTKKLFGNTKTQRNFIKLCSDYKAKYGENSEKKLGHEFSSMYAKIVKKDVERIFKEKIKPSAEIFIDKATGENKIKGDGSASSKIFSSFGEAIHKQKQKKEKVGGYFDDIDTEEEYDYGLLLEPDVVNYNYNYETKSIKPVNPFKLFNKK